MNTMDAKSQRSYGLFNNVTETIDVPKYDPPDKGYADINDPILRAIKKIQISSRYT